MLQWISELRKIGPLTISGVKPNGQTQTSRSSPRRREQVEIEPLTRRFMPNLLFRECLELEGKGAAGDIDLYSTDQSWNRSENPCVLWWNALKSELTPQRGRLTSREARLRWRWLFISLGRGRPVECPGLREKRDLFPPDVTNLINALVVKNSGGHW
ncbi:MAG TPA: hypothetical protein VEV17_18365 [Bryobacteraceae bacterium]|nr:hypothetical protein [Bryobacteraceae bacterium]